MKIDEKTLSQLEHLAKLHLDESERELAKQKLVHILNILDEVNEADIADLAPLYHPLEITQAFRDDIADANINREVLQQNAPKVENGLYLVPKVIE